MRKVNQPHLRLLRRRSLFSCKSVLNVIRHMAVKWQNHAHNGMYLASKFSNCHIASNLPHFLFFSIQIKKHTVWIYKARSLKSCNQNVIFPFFCSPALTLDVFHLKTWYLLHFAHQMIWTLNISISMCTAYTRWKNNANKCITTTKKINWKWGGYMLCWKYTVIIRRTNIHKKCPQ